MKHFADLATLFEGTHSEHLQVEAFSLGCPVDCFVEQFAISL